MADQVPKKLPKPKKTPRARGAKRSLEELTDLSPSVVHHDYNEWRDIWRSIRHAMLGEPAIKREQKRYLPQPEGMDDDQYESYVDRAVFFNMTYRTVTGLTGSIFRRAPRLLKSGPKLQKLVKRISKDGMSLELFAKITAQEQLSVGRYGVLLDKSKQERAEPYLAGYTTENILDWTESEIDGRVQMDYVLLREFKTDRRLAVPNGLKGKSAAMMQNPTYGQLFQRYRILRLRWNAEDDRYEYIQELYERPDQDGDLSDTPEVIKPLIFGTPFRTIPFKIFSATTSKPEIEKPPILDILSLNLSHYKTYAELEQGRFYTANPVYYVTGSGEDDEYKIGPSLVWDLNQGEKAGIIEFNGHGLKSLETALNTKENQVAALGGRLIGDSGSAGQSDNQIKLKDRNEQSLLLNVTTVLNENFTELLILLAKWMNEDTEELVFRVNQDFLLNNFAAREFRAITLMWQEGLLPLSAIYEFFLQHEVIPEYITEEQFRAMLEDEKEFINNPDVVAKKEGFPDAKSKLEDEQLDREMDNDNKQKDKDRKANKDKPEIPVVPPQAKEAEIKDAE